MSDEKKLNIIKYSKRFQKKLGIDLYYYKIYSGKYIKQESNQKVKIYNANNNEILFEGEYLKGKKMVKEKNIG